MPVTVTLTNPLERLQQKLDRLNSSPELIEKLGADLSKRLSDNSPVDTGATARAFKHIGQPTKIVNGWKIGMGSGEAFGSEDEPAPCGTLRAFYSYLESQGVEVRYTDWRNMEPAHQDRLAQARRKGLYGGRGVDYANYMWIQNAGNSRAHIRPLHFIEKSITEFRSSVGDIIREYFTTL
jgi:hypothetical protein